MFPAFLGFIAENDPATVSSAITGMATTVATDGQTMLTTAITTLAPLIGAGIVARLGYKYVQRFSK